MKIAKLLVAWFALLAIYGQLYRLAPQYGTAGFIALLVAFWATQRVIFRSGSRS